MSCFHGRFRESENYAPPTEVKLALRGKSLNRPVCCDSTVGQCPKRAQECNGVHILLRTNGATQQCCPAYLFGLRCLESKSFEHTLPICQAFVARVCDQGEHCSMIHRSWHNRQVTRILVFREAQKQQNIEAKVKYTVDVGKERELKNPCEKWKEATKKKLPESNPAHQQWEGRSKKARTVQQSSSSSSDRQEEHRRTLPQKIRVRKEGRTIVQVRDALNSVIKQYEKKGKYRIILPPITIDKGDGCHNTLYSHCTQSKLQGPMSDMSEVYRGLVPFLLYLMADPVLYVAEETAIWCKPLDAATVLVSQEAWEDTRTKYCIRCLEEVEEEKEAHGEDALKAWLRALPLHRVNRLKLCQRCQDTKAVYSYGSATAVSSDPVA
jgi:hypothetical protein